VREGALARVVAEQVPLRQRRPFVGQFVLLADEHHPTVETLFPQGLGRLRTGERRSDDDEHLLRHD
jgi:hypothetical protein